MTTRKPGLQEDHAPFEQEAAPVGEAENTLDARAVQGDIDFKAMRARLTGRFPETLAKLAE